MSVGRRSWLLAGIRIMIANLAFFLESDKNNENGSK